MSPIRPSLTHKVLGATKKAGVRRLLVVGGAGSLAVAPGVQLVDTPEFPDIYKAEALAGRDFLNVLRTEAFFGLVRSGRAHVRSRSERGSLPARS
jgi:putative NADH-flavin reductase